MERAYSGMDRGVHHHSIDINAGHACSWHRVICSDDTGDSDDMHRGCCGRNMSGGYIWKEI